MELLVFYSEGYEDTEMTKKEKERQKEVKETLNKAGY
jgi:hypothetical protein